MQPGLESESELDLEENTSLQFSQSAARELSSWVLKYRLLLGVGMLLIFISTGATLYEPFLFGKAIDGAIQTHNSQKLTVYVLWLLGVEILRLLSSIGHGYIFSLIGQKVMQDLRLALVWRLQRAPVKVFDENPVGRFITRITNDIASLAEMFSAGVAAIVTQFLVMTGILVWLFMIDMKLAAASLAVFPILLWVSSILTVKLKRAYRDARSRLSSLNAFLAENILGMKVVHLFNRQKIHLQRFENINARYTQAQIGSIQVYALLQPAITIATGITVAIVLGAGGQRALDSTLSIGQWVAFFAFTLALFQPIREIADKWNVFLSGMAGAERIFSILRLPVELAEDASGRPKKLNFKGHIVFENVWFAYNVVAGAPHWVLKDFSLEILPGQKIGFIGHTGAGKTTVISLLLRFYKPQRGRIFIDGKNIEEYDLRELRAAMGIVQQDVFLFSGTLEENASLRDERRGDQLSALPQSLRQKLPESGDLAERGANLSMGQRQVLAFARAQAAEPSVWILDEATSNVDSQTEAELGLALKQEIYGKTILVVAHRLATIQDADQIIVLNHGVLVEKGRHPDLIRQDGLYARLYRYQDSLVEMVHPSASPPA